MNMAATAESGVVTIKDAAKALGISEQTLRRWDKAGKFRAKRHPINGYRLYPRAQLEKLRSLIGEEGGGT
jgi:DNA-binding transcriptional MerR regulator